MRDKAVASPPTAATKHSESRNKAKKSKKYCPSPLQVYGNDDTQCPERAGGKNASRLYIDSSEPSPGGTGKWTADETLRFTCYNEGGSDNRPVQCQCQK